MERLLIPPVAQNMTLALYGPERAWYQTLIERRRRAEGLVSELVRQGSAIPLPAQDTRPIPPPPPPKVDDPIVDEVVDRFRRARVLRHFDGGDANENVPARLVYFTGGHWAAFGPKHRVNTVVHSRVSGGSDEPTLNTVAASDLGPGDLVVMVRGSDREALRHEADRELPSGIRDTAAEWRRALRRFLDAGQTPSELKRRLGQQGCHRSWPTIRAWLDDDGAAIGPKDDETLEAIQKATVDAELTSKLKDCREAIRRIRGTHLRVAHRLATKVLERVQEWLDIDTPPDQLVEVEERLVLLTVEVIDPESTQVPRSALNQFHEEPA